MAWETKTKSSSCKTVYQCGISVERELKNVRERCQGYIATLLHCYISTGEMEVKEEKEEEKEVYEVNEAPCAWRAT